ncbi:MAG: hypothetical protein KTR16_00985 [Acidiferrobacterales bacterium]|nr:hypothetical protein [Acidiferrobacterales bacterium]
MINATQFFRRLTLASLFILLAACGSSDLEVTAQFANTQDIDEGASVYFDEQPIGEVVDTKKVGNGMSVVIELQPEAAELVSSEAAIVVNRLTQSTQLQIYNPNDASAEFVQNGQQLEGLDSMFQLGAWMVGDAIQLGSDTLNDYVGAFTEYLQSDKFQQDKNTITEQVDIVSDEAQKTIESLGIEFSNAMQDLTSSEGEAAEALEQLGEELSPVVQEIAKSGSLLMAQLEAFTESLEQTEASEQQAGQTFLESLTTTLEKLNESLDAGVEEAEEVVEEQRLEESAEQ